MTAMHLSVLMENEATVESAVRPVPVPHIAIDCCEPTYLVAFLGSEFVGALPLILGSYSFAIFALLPGIRNRRIGLKYPKVTRKSE